MDDELKHQFCTFENLKDNSEYGNCANKEDNAQC